MTHLLRPTKAAPSLASSMVRATLWVAAVFILHPFDAAAKSEEAASAVLRGEPAVAHLKQTEAYESLGEAVRAARYRVETDETGRRVMNDANGFQVSFAGNGWQLKPAEKDKTWVSNWRLRSFGYGAEQTMAADGGWHSAENRVELRRESQQITEWFVNSPKGVEHGFTLAARPGTEKGGEPLRLVMKLEGDLTARADDDGQVLTLLESDGAEALRYEKLKVWDARGRQLAARMRTEYGGEVWLEVEESAAQYPITIDPTFVQQSKLIANDGGGGEFGGGESFGHSVAISGDTAIVGAPYQPFFEDENGENYWIGAAYVFVRSGTTWTEQQKLTASDGETADLFGWSVAISGDTAVVGATEDDTNANSGQGSAYVFVRSGTTWMEQQKLTASDGAPDDRFSYSLAISGDTLIAGAVDEYDNENNDPTRYGSAYIFVRNGTTWTQQQKLMATDRLQAREFGEHVAISGDTVIVDADMDVSGDPGLAYIFVRSGTTWTQQQKLTSSSVSFFNAFYNSVGISGDTAIVGADYDTPSGSNHQGAALIFVRNGTVWTEQQKLTASDGVGGPPGSSLGDYFGSSVAISGDTIIIGAPGDASFGPETGEGSAYIFVRSGTTWTQRQKLTACDLGNDDSFGSDVAISGDTAIIGNATDTIGANEYQGSAYVFALSLTPNTPVGTNVVVSSCSGDVGVTFSQVTGAGDTTFAPIDPFSAGTPPPGYSILNAARAYDITTTATYTPPVTVCFTVSSINTETQFARARILHRENGQLIDRTILAPDSPAPDFATRRLCARVDSLSPFVIAFAPGAPPPAGTFLVTNTDDSGAGSLRQAILDANAAPGANNLTFDILFDFPQTITLTTGELLFPDSADANVTITGPGANLLTVSGNSVSRIFTILEAPVVNISRMTLAGGNGVGSTSGFGGAIHTQGALTLTDMGISGNGATVNGGGIEVGVDDPLTAIRCVISRNTANSDSSGTGRGGGINSGTGSTLVITDSVIDGNSVSGTTTAANNSGGIHSAGSLALTNSTVSFNRARRDGGGMSLSGSATITGCTISGNSATQKGGGIMNTSAMLTLTSSTIVSNSGSGGGGGVNSLSSAGPTNARSTIIAKNLGNATGHDYAGVVNSQGYNLIETTTGTTITGDTTGNITGVDPNLGPLQDNGGPTFTRALLAGSPALDQGASSGATTDQRGRPRPVDDASIPNAPDGDGADIGAFELEFPHPNVRITSITKTGNSVLLQGLGVPAAIYEIEATEDLAQGFDPDPIGSATAGSNGKFQLIDTTNLPRRFYRVVYP